jgi:hypothetical protein
MEQPGLTKSAATSPLEWVLSQTTNTAFKDSDPIKADLNLSDWTTAELNVIVMP